MAKQFNITGSCNPERHYMVDSPERFQRIKAMIDAGDYFTINRGRQFGKTTTLNMIWRQLSDQYLVIPLSFEGIGETQRKKDAIAPTWINCKEKQIFEAIV